MPIRIQRASSIITTLSVVFLTGYGIFVADFGPHEHVFSAPRRWLDRQKASFFQLSEEDKKAAQQIASSSRQSSS
ncbi:hypothetical protein DL93DRAFT_2071506 [Clavulina sp. PMI_390]|nr:hypothetical protein DL93DRAFT_2071506 [Clavulina sp. PMI_390]